MYPHVCTIKTRSAGTAGALGGQIPTYSTGTSTPCEFWFGGKSLRGGDGVIIKGGISGERIDSAPMLKVPAGSVVPALTDHAVTTQTGWAGTYEIDEVNPSPGMAGTVHHYECTIRKVSA